MKTYLWRIKKQKLTKTNLTLYSDFVKKHYKINSKNNFDKIWKWSVDNPEDFWKSIWNFTKAKGDLGKTLFEGPADKIIQDDRIRELYLGKRATSA